MFGLSPVPSQGVTNIYVQGATSGYGTFEATGAVSITGGAATFSVPFSAGMAFPASRTQFINPLDIDWSVAQAGGSCASGCADAGTSSNPVYVTSADNVLPAWAQPIMLTYVSLGVGNGGATSEAAALADTWAQFSTGMGPANVKTWDNRSMEYYTSGFGPCAVNAAQVVMNIYLDQFGNPHYSTSAQCGAFALLLQSALAMNGIHSNWITVQAAYQPGPAEWSKMVIRKWCFIGDSGCQSGSPSFPLEPYWKFRLRLNPEITGDYMVPPRSDYGDLQNRLGLPGQGGKDTTFPPYTPLEKVFDYHFIVQVPILDGFPVSGNQYYDPSYGVTYPSELGFESQAVAGYAYEFPDDEDTGTYHVFRPISGSPNIRFVPVLERSM